MKSRDCKVSGIREPLKVQVAWSRTKCTLGVSSSSKGSTHHTFGKVNGISNEGGNDKFVYQSFLHGGEHMPLDEILINLKHGC